MNFAVAQPLAPAVNLGRIYQLLVQSSPLSRQELAAQSSLTPASLTKFSRQLLQLKLVEEMSPQKSTGGRRAINLTTFDKAYRIIAIHLYATDLVISLIDLGGHIYTSRQYQLVTPLSNQALEQQIQHGIEALLNEPVTGLAEMLAISVVDGLSGYVEPLDLTELPANLQQQFHLPSYLSSEIQSRALCEHYLGAAQSSQNAYLVNLQQKISGCLINSQQPLQSSETGAGLGHIQIDPLGEPCECGHFGCLNTFASEQAILAKTEQLIRSEHPTLLSYDTLSIDTICEAAQQADPLAQQVLKEAVEALGKALAVTVNLLPLDRIILSGRLGQVWQLLRPTLQASIQQQAFPPAVKSLNLVLAQWDQQPTRLATAIIQHALFSGELIQQLQQKQSPTKD